MLKDKKSNVNSKNKLSFFKNKHNKLKKLLSKTKKLRQSKNKLNQAEKVKNDLLYFICFKKKPIEINKLKTVS